MLPIAAPYCNNVSAFFRFNGRFTLRRLKKNIIPTKIKIKPRINPKLKLFFCTGNFGCIFIRKVLGECL